MKKIAIIIVSILLVVAGVSAVMAYSNAVVQSPATLRVVSTDEALLALDVVPEAGDLCEIKDGALVFEFGAFKPDDFFIWDEFFVVTNKSEDKIKFMVENDGLTYVYVDDFPGAEGDLPDYFDMVEDIQDQVQADYYELDPGESVALGVAIIVPPEDADTGTFNGSLKVKAEAIQ